MENKRTMRLYRLMSRQIRKLLQNWTAMEEAFLILLIAVSLSVAAEPDHWNVAFDRLAKSTPKDVVDWVNPFICTKGDNGQLYPGAVAPFGLVKLSPDTDGKAHSGYDFAEPYMHGFSHIRIGGTG